MARTVTAELDGYAAAFADVGFVSIPDILSAGDIVRARALLGARCLRACVSAAWRVPQL
jgi:hypothetical protein